MKKQKVLLSVIIFAFILLIATISNAADKQTTSTTMESGVIVNWEYTLDENGNINDLVCANSNKNTVTGTIVIPSKIDEHDVVGLGNNAFSDCVGMQNVEIPDSIVTIGSVAFRGCKGLGSIEIPDSVIELGSGAFTDCNGLSSVKLSKNMTKIDTHCFTRTKIEEIILYDKITTISDNAFCGCSKLKKILIPDSVVAIGEFWNTTFGDAYLNDLTIYGNEGSTAQEFARENGIKFDYIENWDKGSGEVIPSLESISLSRTAEVKLGKTLTLTPTFSPDNTIYRTVRWTSSDESVATVDSTGKITPKKIGSTVITVISTQDESKKATCTVTVVETSSGGQDSGGSSGSGASGSGITSGGTGTTDTSIATYKTLPNTGLSMAIIGSILLVAIGGIALLAKYNKYKDVK